MSVKKEPGEKQEHIDMKMATATLFCREKRLWAEKFDIFTVAKIAGIMGAKNPRNYTSLPHPLSLAHIDVDFSFDDKSLHWHYFWQDKRADRR